MENSYEIVFDKDSSKAAIECLMNMVELERTPKFGSLKNEYAKTNRYKIEENNVIDSRYYTDKSTTLLFYAMEVYGGVDFWSNKKMTDLHEKFKNVVHDFEDNSFSNEKNDRSIVEMNNGIEIDDFGKLYAFYSGFELLNEKEEEELVKTLAYDLDDIDYNAILKKTEVINGVEKTFYYLSADWFDTYTQTINHQLYVDYIEARFSGDILKSLSENANGNDIIIFSSSYSDLMGNIAAYANSDRGHVVVNEEYYEDSICHEIGHVFDLNVSFDRLYFDINGVFGLWDSLANKYAEDVYTIRQGADISCGYSAEAMEDDHREFYAEAFQLYFYSPETRAALPKKIRKTIEYEINRFTGDRK